MNSDRLFLIGLPGSGKSSLGEKISAILQLPFFDLDQCIEKRESRSIPEIFTSSGENYFRQVETEELERVIRENKKLVLSAGGGTACFNNNMTLMNNSGATVYLDVPIEVLLDRLLSSGIQRPMFRGLDQKSAFEKLSELKRIRLDFYQQANLTISGNSITPEEILKALR